MENQSEVSDVFSPQYPRGTGEKGLVLLCLQLSGIRVRRRLTFQTTWRTYIFNFDEWFVTGKILLEQ